MKTIKRATLLLLLTMLCAAMGWAQPYRINRQQLCIEGANFIKKASVGSSNYLFMDDFSIAPGQTKTVPVYLTSSMPIWLFQADVVLPSGLTATDVDFSSAFYGIAAAPQYAIQSGVVNGNFRILTVNTTKTLSIPADTRQHLLDLTITASSGLLPQTLTATISGFDFIEASTGHEYAYEGDSRSCTVTISEQMATDLTLTPSELNMSVGDQSTIIATVTPSTVSQNVVWGSSKTDVATVNQSGVVTATGEGTAVITATTTDGSYITRTCMVTVSRPQATSVSVTPNAITLQVGSTEQLTAAVLPGAALQRVTWSTSNSSVATVSSNGLVTATDAGTAIITATAQDGSGKYGVCSVIVPPPAATSLTLNTGVLTIETGQCAQIMGTVMPHSAVQTLEWSSSNPSVATVDAIGLVTGMNEGYAVVTARTIDGSNLAASCTVIVNDNSVRGDVTDDGVVDIDDVNTIINIMLGKDPGKQYVVNGVRFNMVRVQGGAFTMGGTTEQGSDVAENELPPHQVIVTSYSIGTTEVTQELWQAVMGSNPSHFTGDLSRPVENVSWNDCQEFITRLNALTGQSFRLPTEAEWEYAARGGNKSQGYKYAGSNDANSVAWYKGNCGNTTHPVGQKEPNELGLYDMSGNVMEFCSDWFGSYNTETQVNPTGPATGTRRVCRGGSYSYDAEVSRVSNRGSLVPTATTFARGLRLAQ